MDFIDNFGRFDDLEQISLTLTCHKGFHGFLIPSVGGSFAMAGGAGAYGQDAIGRDAVGISGLGPRRIRREIQSFTLYLPP
jgi:hypothetical protein